MGSPSWIIEKKFVEGQKGDDITPFDGILKKPLILHVLQEFYDGIFSSLSSSDVESETVTSKRVKERKYCWPIFTCSSKEISIVPFREISFPTLAYAV
jgi:hypothetical protein